MVPRLPEAPVSRDPLRFDFSGPPPPGPRYEQLLTYIELGLSKATREYRALQPDAPEGESWAEVENAREALRELRFLLRLEER